MLNLPNGSRIVLQPDEVLVDGASVGDIDTNGAYVPKPEIGPTVVAIINRAIQAHKRGMTSHILCYWGGALSDGARDPHTVAMNHERTAQYRAMYNRGPRLKPKSHGIVGVANRMDHGDRAFHMSAR